MNKDTIDLGDVYEKKELNIILTANFTSEPIERYLKFWLDNFKMSYDFKLAQYNQIFQTIMEFNDTPGSSNHNIEIVLISVDDWIKDLENRTKQEVCTFVSDLFQELMYAFMNQKNKVQYLVTILPPSRALFLQDVINKFSKVLKEMVHITYVDVSNLHQMYSFHQTYDLYRDRIANIPFAEEYYAALGTVIARKLCALKKHKFKVIILDCDNVLWNGICGEDGFDGIVIDDNRKAIQLLLTDLCNKGILLALCSKNNEQDVSFVFERNKDMVLKKSHIVSSYINWNVKSENIKRIAEELNLGLDSFIFIDDSISECYEVMKNCPQVLTLNVPYDSKAALHFLSHVWALDKEETTEEDRTRTKMYFAQKERYHLKQNTRSIRDYLNSLRLNVSIHTLQDDELVRVAQLLIRTNQFNIGSPIRSEQELQELVMNSEYDMYAVEAKDRFGSYGIIGFMIVHKMDRKTISVDTFLLSCRALGKDIEYAVLSYLKRRYSAEKESLVIKLCRSERNRPIQLFIENNQWKLEKDTGSEAVYSCLLSSIKDQPSHINMQEERFSEINKEKKQVLDSEFMMDHIGIVTKEIKLASQYYLENGYQCSQPLYDEMQDVYLCMCKKKDRLDVELIQPASDRSPVISYLSENETVPYHLCLRVKNIDTVLDVLKKKNIAYEVVSERKKAVLFHYQYVTFVLIKNIGLIELLEVGDVELLKIQNSCEDTIVLYSTDIDVALDFFEIIGYQEEYKTNIRHNEVCSSLVSRKNMANIEICYYYDNKNSKMDLHKLPTYILYILHQDDKEKHFKGLSSILSMEKSTGSPTVWPVESLHNKEYYSQFHFDIEYKLDYDKTHYVENIHWDVNVYNEDNLRHKQYLETLSYHEAGCIIEAVKKNYDSSKVIEHSMNPDHSLEHSILNICREVSERPNMGFKDNLYESGCNSIDLVQIMSRVYLQYHVELPMNKLIRTATPNMIVQYIKIEQEKVYKEGGHVVE